MKKMLLYLGMMVTSFTGFAQTSDAASEQLLKNLIQDSFDEIFSDLNEKMISKYYTDDFLLLEHGEVWTNETLRKYLSYAQLQKDGTIRKNALDFIEIKIEGKLAWLAYHNTATFVKKDEVLGEMKWLESATAILTAEGWKLQMLHSTIIPKK